LEKNLSKSDITNQKLQTVVARRVLKTTATMMALPLPKIKKYVFQSFWETATTACYLLKINGT